MEIKPENRVKIEALINKFTEDLTALGGDVNEEYDNEGQKVLYLGLWAGDNDTLHDEMPEEDGG